MTPKANPTAGSCNWWNDAIESIANGDVSGGPYRDTDIYGNVLAFSNDDGTELDGGQINVRYWHNWIAWALCGISCAPNRSGPSYVFRNVVATLGEERESTGSAFKMGGAALSPGVNFIAHNTIFGPGGGLRSVGYGQGPDRGATWRSRATTSLRVLATRTWSTSRLTPATTLTTT